MLLGFILISGGSGGGGGGRRRMGPGQHSPFQHRDRGHSEEDEKRCSLLQHVL